MKAELVENHSPDPYFALPEDRALHAMKLVGNGTLENRLGEELYEALLKSGTSIEAFASRQVLLETHARVKACVEGGMVEIPELSTQSITDLEGLEPNERKAVWASALSFAQKKMEQERLNRISESHQYLQAG